MNRRYNRMGAHSWCYEALFDEHKKLVNESRRKKTFEEYQYNKYDLRLPTNDSIHLRSNYGTILKIDK